MHGGCEVGVFCAVKREDWSQETRREILIYNAGWATRIVCAIRWVKSEEEEVMCYLVICLLNCKMGNMSQNTF